MNIWFEFSSKSKTSRGIVAPSAPRPEWKIICLILWSCTRCTCEHRGVAGRHVVLEHPLLQADLGEMEMKGSFQIMVTWSEMILGNFNLRGHDNRGGMSLIFSPGPRKVQFDQGPCGSY